MPNKPYSEDCKEILPDKSEKVQLLMAENYQEEIIPPPPSMIKRVKTFYLNTGVIKEELSTYIGLHFPVGEIKYYDQKGNLVKTEDTDLAYKDFFVKLLDLFEILQKEPLLDGLSMEEKENFNRIFEIRKESKDVSLEDVFKEFKQNKFLNSMDDKDRRSLIGIDFNETKKEWKVVKDLYPFGLINIKVDANDGRVLEKKYEAEKRPWFSISNYKKSKVWEGRDAVYKYACRKSTDFMGNNKAKLKETNDNVTAESMWLL